MATKGYQPKMVYGKPNPNYTGPNKASNMDNDTLEEIGYNASFASSDNSVGEVSEKELQQFYNDTMEEFEEQINERWDEDENIEKYEDMVKEKFKELLDDNYDYFQSISKSDEEYEIEVVSLAGEAVDYFKDGGYDDFLASERADMLNDEIWIAERV